MKDNARKLTALLTVLVMVCSFAALSASAAETAGVSVDAVHRRFIYANSPYTTEARLKKLAGTLEGTLVDGSKVDVSASWKWDSSGEWTFQPQGCAGTHYGFYQFQSASLTAAGGNRTVSGSAELEVLVIAVNAAQILETTSGTALRSRLSKFTGDNWKEVLGLPDTARVTYAPAVITGHPEWSAAAGAFYERDAAYKISGWTMEDYYAPLTPQRLQNAIAEGKREIRLTPVYARSGRDSCPAWATLETLPTFTLTIVDDQAVEIAVTAPDSIAYGEELCDPAAEQTSGGTDGEGSFTYRYVGVEGTVYNSAKKPAEAGAYQVSATLNSATHSGEGVSETFRIRRAPTGAATIRLTVPAAGGSRTVFLDGMGLPEGMAKGAKLKTALGTEAGEVLAGGKAGDDFFTLSLEPEEAGRTWSFPLVLTSNNYEAAAVTVRLTASTAREGFRISHVAVKTPGAFSYGTPLRDIIDLERCTATLDGVDTSGSFELVEPGRCYATGEDTVVRLRFRQGSEARQAAGRALFTIHPAGLTPTGWDGPLIRDGYYITTYANSPYNVNLETLRALVQDRKRSYNVDYAGGNFDMDAVWHTDVENPAFDPQGQKPHIVGDILWYDWYAYTAELIPRDVKARNIDVDFTAKAYVRVVPVLATPALARSVGTVTAEAVETLTADNWKEVLNLPKTASVRYEPVEIPQWSDAYIPPSDKMLSIAGWKLDGIILTPAALRAKAVGREDVRVTLTPIYEDLPVWATLAAEPVFELTIVRDNGTKNSGGTKKSQSAYISNHGAGNTEFTTAAVNSASASGVTAKNPDGSTTTVDAKKDGTVVVTVKKRDGSTGTIITDASGQIRAAVHLPFKAASGATGGGSAISLPVQGIRAPQNIDRAPVVIIETSGGNGVKVNIPVVNHGPSIVAVRIKDDGAGQIIKNTVPTQDGVAVRVNSGDTLKILDNRKTFADMTDHWAADAVDFVSSRELFFGARPGIFSPGAKMTRGMLMTVLARYENVNTEGGAAYYEKGAAWAVTNGLSDGSRIDAEITREQLVTILYRYCILKNKLSCEGADLADYKDADCVGLWARDAMSWAVGAGLIKGTTPTTLDPKGGATRAQVAAIIMRYAETFGL